MNKEENLEKRKEGKKRNVQFSDKSHTVGLISMMIVALGLLLFKLYKGQPIQDILAMIWGLLFGVNLHHGIVNRHRGTIIMTIPYFGLMVVNIISYVTSDF